MAEPVRILLIDSDESDIELAETLLRRDLPAAVITTVSDTAALIAALGKPAADVAVVAPRLGWAAADKVLALLGREWPGTAIVLFGHESDLVERCLNPGLAMAGIARKSSGGFMALSGIVRQAIAGTQSGDTLSLADLPLPAFFVSAEGRLTLANDAFITHSDRSAETLASTPLDALCADQQAAQAWTAFRTGNADQLELRLRFANNEIRQARLRRDPGRVPERRFLATLTEATPAEINVVTPHSREQSNREMHDIALVFSHDLKEPVQQIMRLVRRIEDRAGIDEPGAYGKLTQQLHTCAGRASAMLDSMLEYLAVSARDQRPGLVDLNDCLEQALDNLRASIDDSGAQIVSDQLPSVAGDAYQLLHLFQNLIGNAIKFHGHERPQIRITASSAATMWRIAFQDNGIGIAEPFRERVFDMGKRLHTREEYPGGGIGLTLCRRISERHGGTIHIEAAENGGSVVVVELPCAPSHVTRLA